MSESPDRREVQVPAGRIRYREAGEGKPVVFVHGYMVDGRLWDGVVDELSKDHRCLAPDWPLGAHEVAMDADVDLTPYGIADLISSFMEELGLEEATVVGNDTGGAMCQVLVTRHPQRIGRLVLTNCDSHENLPPGIFKAMPQIAKLPGGLTALLAPTRFGPVGRATYRPFTTEPMPSDLIESWLSPRRRDSGIRRDLKAVTIGMNKRYTLEAAEKLRGSDLPLLLAWAPGDRFFPIKYAKRLADGMPNARIVEIPDSKTFVPIDQPSRLADEIRKFIQAG